MKYATYTDAFKRTLKSSGYGEKSINRYFSIIGSDSYNTNLVELSDRGVRVKVSMDNLLFIDVIESEYTEVKTKSENKIKFKILKSKTGGPDVYAIIVSDNTDCTSIGVMSFLSFAEMCIFFKANGVSLSNITEKL